MTAPSLLPAHKNWFLSHGIEVQGHLNTTNDHEEKPNSERFTQRVVVGFCCPNALFLTSIQHMWKTPHTFLTLKFIAKNLLLYFLTFSNVRKGFSHISPGHLQFPHFLHVWNWLQRISSHFSTHSSELENQTKNSLHFSNVWNFDKRSFSYINSTHEENSLLFAIGLPQRGPTVYGYGQYQKNTIFSKPKTCRQFKSGFSFSTSQRKRADKK